MMKTIGWIGIWMVVLTAAAFAQTKDTITYQGTLFDAEDQPLTGSYRILFRLYGHPTEGDNEAAIWAEEISVEVEGGVFAVPLGQTDTFPEGLWENDELWLELEVCDDAMTRTVCDTLLPRQAVRSVPWAMQAHSVNGPVKATSVTVGETEVIDGSGSWTGGSVTATDLNCSGCVSESEVNFNVCTADGSGNAIYANGTAMASGLDCSGCVTASHLADDYTTATEVEAMIGDLPADGLSEVSNGILDNVLSQTNNATDTPKTITDSFPAGINSTISIPTTGTIRSASVTLDITHADIGELEIKLFPPVGGVITLHNHGQSGTVDFSTTYPTETAPAAGSFDNLIGTAPNGNWTLQIIDDASGNEGTLNSWSVNLEYISDIDITLDGNLTVTGDVDVLGMLMRGEIETALVDDERFFTVEQKNDLLPFSGNERIAHVRRNIYSQSDLPSSNFILPYNQSEGTVSLEPGVPHYFTSFELINGVLTANDSSSLPLIIIVTGDCRIDGVIDLKGKGALGGIQGGGAGENGGNGAGPQIQYYYLAGGGGGNAALNAGNNYHSNGGSYNEYNDFLVEDQPNDLLHVWNVFSGAGGGSGGRGFGDGSCGGKEAGNGGNGGGSLIMICYGNVDINGEIILSGANGDAPGDSDCGQGGGGGGGAGGILVFAYGTDFYNDGNIYIGGGTGGSGKDGSSQGNGGGGAGGSGPGSSGTAGTGATETKSGDGGDGGDGKVYIFQL